jgi:hypothetical protein
MTISIYMVKPTRIDPDDQISDILLFPFLEKKLIPPLPILNSAGVLHYLLGSPLHTPSSLVG